ncbi:MAG TPA: response regulator transcription factor [Anaerolineales bacterium]|nr:response regulator transcription factor [Anaerolineales bacterium]
MGTSHSILIIDDEPNLRRSLGLILQRAGYIITTASNAAEAIHLLQAGAYDLTFLDIKLPDQNGIQLLPRLRELYPDMPILILTAHATLDTAIEAVRLGARDYLLKPIDPETILSRVEEILKEAKPKRRREITTQLQTLLSELQSINGKESAVSLVDKSSAVTDPARYLKCGPLVLDRHLHSVQYNNSTTSLPPSTFDYLVTLVRHSPHPVTYEKLVQESQGYQHLSRAEAREISRWQMHEIRRLLEPDPRHPQLIITVRDLGYRLVV